MCAKNPAFVDGTSDFRIGRALACPERQSPPCGRVLLRLHGALPGDDLFRAPMGLAGEALVGQAPPGDLMIHGSMVLIVAYSSSCLS